MANAVCWTNPKMKVLHGCGAINKVVMIIPTFDEKVGALMEVMGAKEWTGYIVGKIANNMVYAEDILIPQQVVTHSDVHPDTSTIDLTNVIGTIHSHHSMGLFTSGPDNEYNVSNHLLTIVVAFAENSNTHKYLSIIKEKVSCGNIAAAQVTTHVMKNNKYSAFIKDSLTKIKIK